MSNEQLTDEQLSERVCKALGIEPLSWLCKNEWVNTLFLTREDAEEFGKKHGVAPIPTWPSVLDWPGFGRVVERLRELNVYVSTYVHPDTVEVEVVPVKGCYHGEDEKSLPRALALAVIQWEASRG